MRARPSKTRVPIVSRRMFTCPMKLPGWRALPANIATFPASPEAMRGPRAGAPPSGRNLGAGNYARGQRFLAPFTKLHLVRHRPEIMRADARPCRTPSRDGSVPSPNGGNRTITGAICMLRETFFKSLWLATSALCALGAAPASAGSPTTPIRHVIIIVVENHTIDNLFGAYRPKPGQTIDNLLSKGIVKADGTPGPRFEQAAQRIGRD